MTRQDICAFIIILITFLVFQVRQQQEGKNDNPTLEIIPSILHQEISSNRHSNMDHGVVHATFVELSDPAVVGSNPPGVDIMSPDTSEFVALEKQIMDQAPPDPQLPLPPPPLPTVEEGSSNGGTPEVTPPPTPPPPPNFLLDTSGSRKTSDVVQREIEAEEQHRMLLQSELEEKLEERKRSLDLNSDNGLQLMERRQFRQFSRADEYLYAMKEDLAEWMNNLYPHIDMDADNFMNKLETGEHLVQVGVKQSFYYCKLVDVSR